MTRRDFLSILLSGVLCGAGLRHARLFRRRVSFRALHGAGVTDLFGDIAAAIAVGEAYLRTLGVEDVPAHLLSGAGVEPGAAWTLSRAELQRRREQDFLQGRTELMEGWIMARSELCACGLIALLHKSRRRG